MWREQIIPPIRREAHGRRTNVKLQARCFPSLPPFPEIIRRYEANHLLVFRLFGSLLASIPVSFLTSLPLTHFFEASWKMCREKFFPWSAPTLQSPSSQAKLELLEGYFGVYGIAVSGVNFVRYCGIKGKN